MSKSKSKKRSKKRARRDAKEALRVALGSAPIPIVVVDRDGRIRGGWNAAAARLLGWERGEVKGRSFVDLLAPRRASVEPSDAPELGPELAASELAGTAMEPIAVLLTTKSERVVEVTLSTGLLTGAGGVKSGAMVFMEDRSHFRTLEAQLRQAQKLEALGQLTGGIAHDFNNLLTIVQTSAEMLGERGGDDPELNEYLADIVGAVGRGSDLVRRLMAFGRNDPSAMRTIEPGPLVSVYGETLKRVLPESIQVNVTVGPGVPRVRADEGALQQILLNLATNARDAMKGGGHLTLDVSRSAPPGVDPDEDWACITIRDTGSGIPEDQLPQVFEPFFTTKTPDEGTGLGLSMVQELARQMGGTVTVDSTPGAGTEFRMYLPAATESAAPTHPAPRAPRPEEAAADGEGTVLIVEDDASVRKVIRRALTGIGYEVIVTGDGEQALAALGQNRGPVDLIVSDLVMPNMDGPTLYEELHKRGTSPPFLFISGYGEQDCRIDDLVAAGVPLLHKPWSVQDLCDAVRGALKRSSDPKESGKRAVGRP